MSEELRKTQLADVLSLAVGTCLVQLAAPETRKSIMGAFGIAAGSPEEVELLDQTREILWGNHSINGPLKGLGCSGTFSDAIGILSTTAHFAKIKGARKNGAEGAAWAYARELVGMTRQVVEESEAFQAEEARRPGRRAFTPRGA